MISRFEEVEHLPLRTFNRTAMICNLLEDGGKAAVEDYIKDFSSQEIKEINQMYRFVKKNGYKKSRELVTKGMTFTDEDYNGVDIDG